MEFASTNEFILYAILANGVIGGILGLIPLIAGIKKGKRRLGFLGLAASAAGGLLLGLILSVPAAAIFTWLILRHKDTAPSQSE
jgi:hypothetical protein